MLTLVTKCGPFGDPVSEVIRCDHYRNRIRHKKVILSVIVLISVANLFSLLLFFEPPSNFSHSRVSGSPITDATIQNECQRERNASDSAKPAQEARWKSSMSTNPARRPKALVAPRLDRLWPCVWSIKFLIDRPQLCANLVHEPQTEPNWTAIVVVVSAASNFEQRSSVRETWASRLKELDHFRLVFFVGTSAVNESKHESLLLDEAERHADLVQADFVDHYDNLTLKSVLMLRWVTTRCAGAHFLMKVDDDVFVNPINLGVVLDSYRAKFTRVIFGRLALRWQPIRDSHSPYFVSATTWTASEYPNFIAGPAYVVTIDAVGDLLSRVHFVPYFHLEDVYVTGMLAQTAGILRINQPGFVNRKFIINPCVQKNAVTGHHLEADELRAAWDVHRRTMGSAAAHTNDRNNNDDDDDDDDDNCYKVQCKVQFSGLCLLQHKVPIDYYRKYYYDGLRSTAPFL